MTAIGLNNTPTLTPLQASQQKEPKATLASADTTNSLQPESTKVTISDEGKALLNGEPAIDKADKQSELTSFAYGALGLDNPESIPEEEKDASYTAGQYLKGALTIGTILLAVV